MMFWVLVETHGVYTKKIHIVELSFGNGVMQKKHEYLSGQILIGGLENICRVDIDFFSSPKCPPTWFYNLSLRH